MASSLTVPQKVRYDTLKKIVRDNIGSSRKLWGALKAIKEEKLYLHEYDTWEKFCNGQYELSARHADRLIEAGETVKTLENSSKLPDPIGPAGPIQNERQLRELAKVPAEKRAEVLGRAVASGPVTAKAIAAVAKQTKEKPAEILDECDYPVPEELQALWARRQEVEGKLREVAALGNFFEALQATKDPLWIGARPQALMMDFQKLHQELGEARLFAVCIVCQGLGRKACTFCKGKGFNSKFQWNQQSTMEAKEIRRKSMARKRGGA